MSIVAAPALLLTDRCLSSTAKLLWLASQASPPPDVSLAYNTVRKGQAELASSAWNSQVPPAGQTAAIPTALLSERRVGARAKLLYGLLQLTPAFQGRSTSTSYAELGALADASPNTVKLAVQELAETGWLRITREKHTTPPRFVLLDPDHYRQRLEVVRARRRLRKPGSKGEKLMREFLSLLVDCDTFDDEAAPPFLVNPVTQEHLRFDRFYPPGVAFEYNGAQHYGATDWYPSDEDARQQHLRDLIKAGICYYRGIKLVVVHSEDLSLEGMRRKVGALLPFRDLRGHDLLADDLENRGFLYRKAAHRQT